MKFTRREFFKKAGQLAIAIGIAPEIIKNIGLGTSSKVKDFVIETDAPNIIFMDICTKAPTHIGDIMTINEREELVPTKKKTDYCFGIVTNSGIDKKGRPTATIQISGKNYK